MRPHARIRFLLAAAFGGFLPVSLQGQDGPRLVEVEVGAGVTLASEELGVLYPVRPEVGYMELGEIHQWTSIGIGARFRPLWAGIRPTARVDYAFDADVYAQWLPCEPGYPCPAILLEPDVRVSRLAALLGIEVPVPLSLGPVNAHATIGTGLRRYDVQWRTLGEPPTSSFVLPEGSRKESDLLWRVGGGLSAQLGWDLELWGQVAVDMSRFGPGVVPVRAPAEPVEQRTEVDLGRDTRTETSLTVGIRRSIF